MLGGKEVAVIGDGDGGHAAAGRFVNQFRDVASAVEKTVIGVQMQMDETRSCHRRLHSSLRRAIFPDERQDIRDGIHNESTTEGRPAATGRR